MSIGCVKSYPQVHISKLFFYFKNNNLVILILAKYNYREENTLYMTLILALG